MSEAEQYNREFCLTSCVVFEPNLYNAQSAKQHYRNTFTSTLKIWGNEIPTILFLMSCIF